MTNRIGFIGSGHLASYTIAGLRRAGDERGIVLSPRNAEKAAQLAIDYNCQVASSNQALVDVCDIVILAVRPPDAMAVLSELRFRPQQTLVSVVAGIEESQLRDTISADVSICRSLIVSSAAYNQGAISLYPNHHQVADLLAPLGEVVILDTEKEFDLSLAVMCANGWMYTLVAALEQPMIAAGMPAEPARRLLVQSIIGTMAHISEESNMDLAQVTQGIATTGTFTKLGLDILQQQGAFGPWQEAVQTLLMAQNND